MATAAAMEQRKGCGGGANARGSGARMPSATKIKGLC